MHQYYGDPAICVTAGLHASCMQQCDPAMAKVTPARGASDWVSGAFMLLGDNVTTVGSLLMHFPMYPCQCAISALVQMRLIYADVLLLSPKLLSCMHYECVCREPFWAPPSACRGCRTRRLGPPRQSSTEPLLPIKGMRLCAAP